MTTQPPMTRAEIAAARERCEQATPGPWQVVEGRSLTNDVWRLVGDASTMFGCFFEGVGEEPSPQNTAFIAASRTDLPRALDTLDQALELLAWYADPDKYTPACIIYEDGQVDCIGPARIASEGGERAREFLRQVERGRDQG